MLMLDTNEVSDTDLENIVVRHLSPFGTPKIVRVMPRERRGTYEVVAVKMETPAQARFAATRLGHSHYGPIVVVKFARQGTTIPLPLESRSIH